MENKVSGEMCVAIATALYLIQKGPGVHDTENAVLTINRQAHASSPWASKVLTLRQTPIVNGKTR